MKLLKKTDAGDRSKHKFYVVVEQNGQSKLESGWDDIHEARDMARELPAYLRAKVIPVGQLKQFSLDPSNNSHWGDF